jgi:DNA-binding beta-propeller fold protein YncE
MRRLFLIFLLPIFIFLVNLHSTEKPFIEVDFAKLSGLNGNAQGSHILIADNVNSRVFAACVNSSSVAIIDAKTDKVTVIPVSGRMPRRLRVQGAAVNHITGEFAVAGQNSVVIVDTAKSKSRTVPLPEDFTSVAMDEKNGNVLAVGRLSGDLAVITPGADKALFVPYGTKEQDVQYFAVSPPTPIRTVWVDQEDRKIYIFDGTQPKLFVLDADTLKTLNVRDLPLSPFPRWHWGGPDWEDSRFYLSVEDDQRVSRFAVSVDLKGSDDIVVELPSGATEPTGVSISTKRNELYIPYDNNDFIHAVSFSPQPKVEQIPHTAKYGIDSSAFDEDKGLLYAPSWAEGIMFEINVAERKVNHHTPYFPVYPHMNNFAFLPKLGKIYIPSGATAVNGTFGSLITVFNVNTLEQKTIRTGWSPVSLVGIPGKDLFFVFSSDQSFAIVSPGGSVKFKNLPYPYLHDSLYNPSDGNVYAAYGPHYSVFPAYYIRATRGGFYTLNTDGEMVAERQTDRLAQKALIDDSGTLWATENIWGKEEPRLIYFDLKNNSRWGKLMLPPAIDNECALRGLKKNPFNGDLWILRNGDRSSDKGMMYRINPSTKALLATYETGITPTDIAFLENFAIACSFTEDKVTVVNAASENAGEEKVFEINIGDGPIAIAADPSRKEAFVLNHLDSTLSVLICKDNAIQLKKNLKIPGGYKPGNIFFAGGSMYISGHKYDRLVLYRFNPKTEQFKVIMTHNYPYGEISFNQSNAAFANTAQWGDAVYRLNEFALDSKGRLWITDYLSGKLWIVIINGEIK